MNIFFFDVYRQCEEEIAVLKTDNEQLEREKSDYKERLKQLTKTKLVDDLIQKKTGVAQRLSGVLSKKSMMIYFLHFVFFRFNN
jgi:cell division protein FtsB